MNISNNKILISGGASGIGLGLTERFLLEGNTVIICGRRESVLIDLAQKHTALITKVCDLSKESERIALFNWIKTEHPDLNVLVNNAGIQQWMQISDDDFYERAKEEMAINMEAPVHLSALFSQLTSLHTIFNVSSGLAFSPMIKVANYSATKAFVHSFTVSLRAILKEKNIEVIEIIPPAINTDLGGKGIHDYAPPVSEFIQSIFEQLKQGKNSLTFGYSESLSTAGADILQAAFKRMNNL